MMVDIGQVLEQKYAGRFSNFLQGKRMRALELLQVIVTEIPGFDDVHRYKGKKVRFYKKAQLLVNDLAKISGIEEVARISGLEELTGKADYKIPAL